MNRIFSSESKGFAIFFIFCKKTNISLIKGEGAHNIYNIDRNILCMWQILHIVCASLVWQVQATTGIICKDSLPVQHADMQKVKSLPSADSHLQISAKVKFENLGLFSGMFL